jgi:cellulose synthase (UDP-forming)
MDRLVRADIAHSDSPTSAEAFNADATLIYVDPPGRRRARQTVSVVGLLVYASYLVYRALYTINFDALTFSLLVYFAELHGFFSLFFYVHGTWALRARRVVPPSHELTVDLFVTTYNEDVDMLRQTLRAAVAVRAPHRTYVLDDGRRPEVRALAEEIGCTYITRNDNRDAKAGNWNNAFAQTSGDLIATFDADHVPRPDFLERTLGFFRDPDVALVQVPQLYHNLDAVQHRVNWRSRRMHSEQDAFFSLVMPGKDHWNAAFFCGTGAVLRRQALEPHGGILTGTITEDLHTSAVLHTEGWKSVYLNELLVTGLAPLDLKGLATQRLRWAEGNLKVAGYVNPFRARGLTLAQRISYIASLYHWTIGLPKAIYYAAPPWILLSGTFPIANFDRTFLTLYAIFLTTLLVSYRVTSRGRSRLIVDELFNMVSFFTLIRAMKRVSIGRRRLGIFEVTVKRGSGVRDATPVLPHSVLVFASLLAISWSLMGLGFGVNDDRFGVSVAVFWTLYNVTLAGAVLRIAGRPAEKRRGIRFRASFAVESGSGGSGPSRLGVTADIGETGCSLLWPERLDTGARLPLRVHFGPRSADWTGEILGGQGKERDGWYRYGVNFLDLTQADIDLINDSVFAVVIPDLFTMAGQPTLLERGWRHAARHLFGRARARAARQLVRVPGRLHHSGGTIVVTARDLSGSGVSVVSSMPLAAGTTVELSLSGPDRQWRGRATVTRSDHRPSRAGFDTWLLGLKFEQRQDQEDVEIFSRSDAA